MRAEGIFRPIGGVAPDKFRIRKDLSDSPRQVVRVLPGVQGVIMHALWRVAPEVMADLTLKRPLVTFVSPSEGDRPTKFEESLHTALKEAGLTK